MNQTLLMAVCFLVGTVLFALGVYIIATDSKVEGLVGAGCGFVIFAYGLDLYHRRTD